MSETEKQTEEQTEKPVQATEGATLELMERIEKTIAKIRPYIQADGGDVQLVDYKDGVVKVHMLGACAGCMAIDATLTDGIQAILMDEVPEVQKVELDTQYAVDPFGSSGYRYY